jgi:hypothetical protein
MAYTEITVQPSGTTFRSDGQGTAGVAGGEGTGLKFRNDGNVRLYLENTGANTPNVVIGTGSAPAGQAVEDLTIAMVANQDQITKVFPTNPFNAAADPQFVNVWFTGGNEPDVLVTAFTSK